MDSKSFSINGQLVDVINRRIYPALVNIESGYIRSIQEIEKATAQYILPGFIDAHVHIESSMLTPAAFGKAAVAHGTVATVSDPHEIANVCGIQGVSFMLENAASTPLKIHFGAPPCVPATVFETSGAVLNASDIKQLLQREDIFYLSEMMNYPGVLHQDPEVMAKIQAAQNAGKPVDGHAPGLVGNDAMAYAAAGITTDHECFTLQEALDKIKAGMYILIREGSAAKNFEALSELWFQHPDKIMLCSDDKHPDDLMEGHINQLVQRSLEKGADIFDVLYAASILPVKHYGLSVGLLREGDPADFIVSAELSRFENLDTYINGVLVAKAGKSLLSDVPVTTINHFLAQKQHPDDFKTIISGKAGETKVKVIEALDGQLITKQKIETIALQSGMFNPDPENDLLKIGVLNRYNADARPVTAIVQGFGLKKGAIASSVAHDSHNIVFVGCSDEAICEAVNALIDNSGGISVYSNEGLKLLPLPVAGLMSDLDAETIARTYKELDAAAKALGSTLRAPFMTLSFMALPVIPDLKITDKGLFDVAAFQLTTLSAE